ncbi:MAG: hypothetical protein M1834_008637 [Cirrosporium novae-zelandiae]|nr:MAG: hypothetical protein M1834_008637 [Cirrosporium novae-zelandiae]
MAAAATVPPTINDHSLTHEESKEIVEYEKILRLHGQVFTGAHPRLKVPDNALRNSTNTPQVLPFAPTISKLSATEPAKTLPPKLTSLQPQNGNNVSSNQQFHSVQMPSTSIAQSTTTLKLALPGLAFMSQNRQPDPTDSEAEITLERQRIETKYRDEREQRKKSYKMISVAENAQTAANNLDVPDILAKALQLVKPIVSTEDQRANDAAEASDSFDESDLYSSKAPDSSTRGKDSEGRGSRSAEANGVDADSAAGPRPDAPAQEDSNDNIEEGEVQESSVESLDKEPYAGPNRRPTTTQMPGSRYYREESHEEEPEYSPPEPDEPILIEGGPLPVTTYNPGNSHGPIRNQPKKRRSGPYDRNNKRRQPSPEVTVVRNHITSPIAPQPSRVSPLVVAKGSLLTKQQHQLQNRNGSFRDQQSRRPNANAVQPLNVPRKRRRDEREDSPNFNKRRGAEPMEQQEPVIKEEPVSPPPFSRLSNLPPKRPVQGARENYTELVSPRGTAYGYDRSREEPRTPLVYDVDNPQTPVIVRSSSQAGFRRPPVREEPDLRRVASLQYARRPEILYANEASPVEANPIRRTSGTYIEREPRVGSPIIYREPSHRQYIPIDRPSSPYVDLEAAPRIMAPPPRRIVVDEYGNRYYEASPITRIRASVAPPERSGSVNPYYQPSLAQPSRQRAPSVVVESLDNRAYVHEMPPPRAYERRYTEQPQGPQQPRLAYDYPRSYDYADDDLAPRVIRHASVAVQDYPPRQATYFEEAPPLRMQSVHPASNVRYEIPPERLQRYTSVRPEPPSMPPPRRAVATHDVREYSTRPDDIVPRAREYVAPERSARYEYAAPQQRRDDVYMEGDEIGGPAVTEVRNGSGNGHGRTVQRY